MRYAPSQDEQSQSLLPGAVRSLEQRVETFGQQRTSLARTLCDMEALARTLPRGSLKYQHARARVVEIQKELCVLKGKSGVVKKNRNLSDFLIQMFKERVTKAQWDGRRSAEEIWITGALRLIGLVELARGRKGG